MEKIQAAVFLLSVLLGGLAGVQHFAAEDGVKTRVVASALGFEPVEDI